MFYIIFFIGVFFLFILENKSMNIKIFTILLALISFLRYGIGADYFSYLYLYQRLNTSIIGEIFYGVDHQEFLFRVFGSLIKSLGFSYQHYLIIIATINLYFIYRLCKEYSKKPILSMLLYYSFYYFVWTFSGLRQGLTIAVGLYYLIKCLETKQVKKFFLISLALGTIHLSALILIPIYFIAHIEFTRKKLIFILLFSLFFATLPIYRIIIYFDFIPFLFRIIPYIDETLSFSLFNIFDFKSLGRLFFVAIVLLFYDDKAQSNDVTKMTMNIFIISISLYFVLKSSEIIAARFSIYGKMLLLIILANIYDAFRDKDKIKKKIYLLGLIIISFLYLNKEMIAMKHQSGLNFQSLIYVPYVNIFNKENYNFNNRYLELIKEDKQIKR